MSDVLLLQERLRTLLRQFLVEQGEEFWLTALGYFSSYAYKDTKPDSDVDIVFESRKPNLFATMRLQSALSD